MTKREAQARHVWAGRLEQARMVMLAQVDAAWQRACEDISLPDLDDEQPFTLQVRTTLGDLRNLRRYRQP